MKVGDYVRTKVGIFKIGSEKTYNENKREYIPITGRGYTALDVELIEKSSPNIIDLIGVEGDYVNGEKVIRIFNSTFLSMGELPYVITDKSKYEPQEIKSIVTKEQFESMEYKVGE